MKKIYLFIAIFLCIENSFAQNPENQANEGNSSNFEKENSRQKKSENKSNRDLKQNRNRPEDNQRDQSEGERKRPDFQNLSDEKKQLLKVEQEKHRQNVKNIAGIEIVFGEEEQKLSLEQNKSRAENNAKIIEQLSVEKKELLKQEKQRHRQQMQEITGFEMPEMANRGNPPSIGKARNCKNPSLEEIEKHRVAMESLSVEKKQLVKKEMERHRAEMKNITGVELPMPNCND
jgi:hypothetical protein